jgi:hypothetical protein
MQLESVRNYFMIFNYAGSQTIKSSLNHKTINIIAKKNLTKKLKTQNQIN